MNFSYERYIAHVTRQPWCITADKFHAIADLIRLRASGHRLSDDDIQARVGADDTSRQTAARTDGAVAVVPIVGTIAHRADSFEASSGGTSTQRIGAFLKRAVADDSVKSILLDISSPGGSVEGVPELAAQIAAATQVKPVVAISNALSASAAYWLGSQASEFVITPSGLVGSIGVFLLMVDESAALEQAGIKINAISAGDNKLEGAPWQAMSAETQAFLQGQVNAVYGDFLKAVASGRRTSMAKVKADFGQGRVFDAGQALQLGMVDRIATLDETLDRMIRAKGSASSIRRTASVVVDEIHAHEDRALMDALTGQVSDVTALVEVAVASEPEAAPAQDPADDADYRRTRLAIATRRQDRPDAA